MKNRAFSAFPKEGLQFLRSLQRNNNREWFQEHKGIYEEYVHTPMTNLITSLADDFKDFAPEMLAAPKVSAYRIYRDTRFSKDKSPYKTHVAAIFPRSGLGKHEGASLYLHISPSEVFIGGGLYLPETENLNGVRQAIADNPDGFFDIIRNRKFRGMFGDIGGECLSRVPRGFSAEHPAAEYLKHRQFLAGRRMPSTEATAGTLYRTIVETFRVIYPFIRFLNEPIMRNRKLRERQEALLRP